MSIRTEIRDAITGHGQVLFPPEFIGFKGHFPGQPILPAVVQILAAQMMIENELGKRTKMIALKSAKFMEPLRPKQDIGFSWVRKGDGLKFQVRVTVDDRLVSSFIIALESIA